MKCDTCKHKKHHSAGSFYSVAEGGDDPYNYDYCNKGHWGGDPIQSEDQIGMEDPWINCKDWEPKTK